MLTEPGKIGFSVESTNSRDDREVRFTVKDAKANQRFVTKVFKLFGDKDTKLSDSETQVIVRRRSSAIHKTK